MSSWISTEEALPPEKTQLLLMCTDGEICIGTIHRTALGREFSNSNGWFRSLDCVSHWHPLPARPTQRKLLLERIITVQHLTRLVSMFKQRAHRDAGYSFEFTDCGTISAAELERPDLVQRSYSDASPDLSAGILQVFREVSPKRQ